MIAMITSGGAFLYDMPEKQADEFAAGKGLDCCEASKHMKGWIFHGTELPTLISILGVFVCYVSMEDMAGKERAGEYLKVSTHELADVWAKTFIKNRYLGRNKNESN